MAAKRKTTVSIYKIQMHFAIRFYRQFGIWHFSCVRYLNDRVIAMLDKSCLVFAVFFSSSKNSTKSIFNSVGFNDNSGIYAYQYPFRQLFMLTTQNHQITYNSSGIRSLSIFFLPSAAYEHKANEEHVFIFSVWANINFVSTLCSKYSRSLDEFFHVLLCKSFVFVCDFWSLTSKWNLLPFLLIPSFHSKFVHLLSKY